MDRVKYSYGMTVPGPEQYSSIRFDIGMESDVQPGESPQRALKRVKLLVQKKVAIEYGEIEDACSKEDQEED
jgi:hypothetical protein